MKRMNFPHRKEKRRLEAEARNAKTPAERRKAFRKGVAQDATAKAREELTDLGNTAYAPPTQELKHKPFKGGRKHGREKR